MKLAIIGAGMGGGILASELFGSDIDVDIFDIDDIDKKYTEKTNLDNIFITDILESDRRYYGYGGGSNAWHGVLTYLEAEVINEYLIKYGINIYEELLKYERKLKKYFGYNILDLTKKHSLQNSFKYFSADIKLFKIQNRPIRIRKLLQKIVKKKGNINIVKNSIVISVCNSSCNFRTVRFFNNNTIKEKSYDIVVLCAGAFESPRILLQSQKENFLKIGKELEFIGLNLIDHPWVFSGKIRKNDNIKFQYKYAELKSNSGYSFRYGFELRNVQDSKTYCTVVFKPEFISADQRKIIHGLIYSRFSFKTIYSLFKNNNFSDVFSSFISVFSEYFSITKNVKSLNVFCYFNSLVSENRISLSDSFDNFGRNIPIIKLHLNSKYLLYFNDVNKKLNNFANNANLIYDSYKTVFYSGLHHGGTCKISLDNTTGVVNTNLRLHSDERIFICDLSTLPNTGTSNPSFILGLFAVRLANHLKNIKN